MSTELAPQQSAVPALVNPSTEIDASDMALPRLKVGQSMTGHVQNGDVKFGALFTELSSDDPDPQTLAEPSESKGGAGPVRIYVVGGPIKGWSHSEPGGQLETWRFDDPSRHEKAWKTYKYLLSIPDADEDIPFSFLLTRTGRTAAQQINTLLARHAQSGPGYEVGFDLTTKYKENDKGRFYIAQVAPAGVPTSKADKAKYEEHQAIASRLAAFAASSSAATTVSEDAPRDEPAI